MVSAKETNLEGILEGKKQYQVPLYQRVYAWGHRQLDQLWGDIQKLAEDRAADGSATHFIGSLVLASSPDAGPVGVNRYLVVDGQQRLTTLTILLAALRDHRAEVEGAEHRDRINDQYLINRYEQGQPSKLLPTQNDRLSYLAVVRGGPSAGSQDNVGAAYRFFRSRIEAAGHGVDPQRIEEAVLRGLALVAVTAQPGDNAHRIFESLNNTGLRLTQGDLLRNYLFMRLPSRADIVYEDVWLPLQDALSPDSLELLFWLDLVQRDENAKQADTYAGQQARLDRLTSEVAIEAEVRRIAGLGHLLSIALRPERESHAQVRYRLERLRQWGTTTVYPVVLQLLSRRAQGTATDEEVVEALLYLESYLVRRVLIGRATANLNRTLLAAVADVVQGTAVAEALRTSLSSGRKYWGTDAQIRESVHSVPFYWQGRKAQKNLILLWLEESYAGKEMISPRGLTIEHVLPQTLSDEWRASLTLHGDPTADVEIEAVLHTLGNLTLSAYNSELSNRPWGQKQALLADSGLALNRRISTAQAWGFTQIYQRAEELAERVISLWPGPHEEMVERQTRAMDVGLWDRLGEVLAEIPAGRWATYGDVAALLGTAPVPLGNQLARGTDPFAYRVLQASGQVSPGFRWADPLRTDDPRELLAAEGVRFDGNGLADPAQRVRVPDLARFLGWDQDAEDERMILDPLGGVVREGSSETHRHIGVRKTRSSGSRTTLADLVRAGLLHPGEVVTARGGKARGRVGADGSLEFNGDAYSSPSAAGGVVAGHAINGWSYWSVDRDETSVQLQVLRAQFSGRER